LYGVYTPIFPKVLSIAIKYMADDKKIIFSMVGVSKTFPLTNKLLKDIYLSFSMVQRLVLLVSTDQGNQPC